MNIDKNKEKCQVILLPTEKARNNNQMVVNRSGRMALTIPYKYEYLTLMTNEGAIGDGIGIKRFELYIISNQPIRELP